MTHLSSLALLEDLEQTYNVTDDKNSVKSCKNRTRKQCDGKEHFSTSETEKFVKV